MQLIFVVFGLIGLVILGAYALARVVDAQRERAARERYEAKMRLRSTRL